MCHITTLHTQWESEFKKYAPSVKVQIVGDVDKGLDPTADVYILGIIKATHFPKSAFSKIGTVIVDECHISLADTFRDSLLQFEPNYLIGLSATPDRSDGMHSILWPFFGFPEEFIVRKRTKEFTVIKMLTGFVPEIFHNYDGSLNWSGIVNSIAYNNERQKFIASLCERYPNDKILILSNRVCEIIGCANNKNCPCKDPKSIGIVPILKEKGENVESRVGTAKKHDESARILVGTFAKLSIGYDSKRTLLILASDVSDIRQSEGRIRSDNNTVIDLVDAFRAFEGHWEKRKLWFIERGANIRIEHRTKNTESGSAKKITEHKRLLPLQEK